MNTQILSGSDESHLNLFVCTLQAGQPIAVPSETVYGLAAPVNDATALEAIFDIKQRPFNDPLILHIGDSSWLQGWAQDFNTESVARLVKAFWPGPLTLILRKKPEVPDLATAGLPTAGFRMPKHRVFLEIIKRVGVPLAAPSANPFTYISPTRPEHVLRTLGGKIPYIADGGQCEEGVESTILDLSDPEIPRILRPGPIAPDAISAVLGRSVAVAEKKAEATDVHLAPGNFEKHYAPKKPIEHISENAVSSLSEEAAFIFCRGELFNLPKGIRAKALGDLSDPAMIRSRLYATLNELDADEAISKIYLVDWPRTFNDLALDDRIRRALSKR